MLVTAGAPGTDLAIEQVESTPTETCFRCALATIELRNPEVFNTAAQQTLAAVAIVIVTVSALPDDLVDGLARPSLRAGPAVDRDIRHAL